MKWAGDIIRYTDALRLMLAFAIVSLSIIMWHDMNKYFGEVTTAQDVTDSLGGSAAWNDTQNSRQNNEWSNVGSISGKYAVKQAALTFDDGPHAIYTEQLLDGLKERGVKATFFLMGTNIEGNEEIVKRMYEEGHLIGCHTYSHVNLTQMSLDSAIEEIKKDNDLIYSITGSEPEYIRPPYGNWSDSLEENVQMTMIKWDVDPMDWSVQCSNIVVKNVLDNVKGGDIILMHDIFKTSVDAAFEIIDELQQEGYEFVTVDKLIE